MEEFDNKLTLDAEDGSKVTIEVLDIIDSFAYDKTFIIYNFEDKPDDVYASILNEKEDSYSLNEITDPEERAYINSEINRVIEEENLEESEGL